MANKKKIFLKIINKTRIKRIGVFSREKFLIQKPQKLHLKIKVKWKICFLRNIKGKSSAFFVSRKD